MKEYNPIPTKKSPAITLKLQGSILKDLKLRALENGHRLDIEISIRLARSLEQDLAMIEADNVLVYEAFQWIEKNGTL